MMVRLSLIFVGLALGLALMGFVQVPAGSAAMGDHRYRGQVTSYDQAQNTVTVNGKHGERTFDLSGAKMNGTIRPNENVIVRYHDMNGQMVRFVDQGDPARRIRDHGWVRPDGSRERDGLQRRGQLLSRPSFEESSIPEMFLDREPPSRTREGARFLSRPDVIVRSRPRSPVEHLSHFSEELRHRKGLLEEIDSLPVNTLVEDNVARVAAHENRSDPRVDAGDLVEDFFAVLPGASPRR